MPDLLAPIDESPREGLGVRAAIMAGGRSDRMRVTNGPRHKALIEIGGVSLLERNILGLIKAGLTNIVVVTSGQEPEIEAYLAKRGRLLAQKYDATLETFREVTPLGNIGAAAAIGQCGSDVLVVYADNLTSLSPAALIAHHRVSGAALTFATHLWPIRNPFGELEIADGLVRRYLEKPVREVYVSSGSCVVGPRAAALIAPGRPFGASDLCAAVLAADLPVAAYEHDEPWIDVNDAAAIADAETLLHAHRERFA